MLTVLLSGSIPDAMYRAADLRVDSRSSSGSWGTVMACRSTTQKKVSAEGGTARLLHEQGRDGLGREEVLTVLLLKGHPVLDGAKVVAQVDCASGLDPREHAHPTRVEDRRDKTVPPDPESGVTA